MNNKFPPHPFLCMSFVGFFFVCFFERHLIQRMLHPGAAEDFPTQMERAGAELLCCFQYGS